MLLFLIVLNIYMQINAKLSYVPIVDLTSNKNGSFPFAPSRTKVCYGNDSQNGDNTYSYFNDDLIECCFNQLNCLTLDECGYRNPFYLLNIL